MALFYTWTTYFDEMAKANPTTNKRPMKQSLTAHLAAFQPLMVKGKLDHKATVKSLLRLVEEYLWIRAGRPYYNVDSRVVGQLCGCETDSLPASYLEVPGELDAVVVRFCEPVPELEVDDHDFVRSVLISRSLMGLPHDMFNDVILQERMPSDIESHIKYLIMRIDFGEVVSGDSPRVPNRREFYIPISPDITLDEAYELSIMDESDRRCIGERRREVMRNCLHLLATVGLLSNCPDEDLIQYDVLSKDRGAFQMADEQKRQIIIDRARRRGKIGWNVGTNEMSVGEIPRRSVPASGESHRCGEHSHSHIRRGHAHIVRFGPGKKQAKVKWFRPTVVRRDLGFPKTQNRLGESN